MNVQRAEPCRPEARGDTLAMTVSKGIRIYTLRGDTGKGVCRVCYALTHRMQTETP